MPPYVVGIDIETTSLEPESGEIIEVAAIKYRLPDMQETDRYVSLCQPSAPIPYEVTAITAITQAMVKDTEPFASHLDNLRKIIGKHIVFAHNAPFDINFLAYHGLKLSNHVWDTFILSGIAWPEAASYNLGMLADQLNLKKTGEHRAGDDVNITWQLLQKIIEQLKVNKKTYKTIEELLSEAQLGHYLPLFTVSSSTRVKKITPNARRRTPNTGKEAKYEITNAKYRKIFGPQGILEQNLPGFHYRSEQLEMAREIDRAIINKNIALIEAGTGIGKTYAYLVPLIKHLTKSKTAIVSTYTKHLQDQLVDHDIPKLLFALGINVKTAVLKGRRNYLCQSRLIQALKRERLKQDDILLLLKVLAWLDHGGSGDIERLNTSHQQSHLLLHLHADSLSCRLLCPKEHPDCPYLRAKKAAKEADLVVVNHALLIQLNNGEPTPIPFTNIIIDEAHHLESTARSASAKDFSDHRLAEVIAPFLQLAKTLPVSRKQHLKKEAEAIIKSYRDFLLAVTDFMNYSASARTLRLSPAARKSTSWQKIADRGRTWRGHIQFFIGLLEGMTVKSSTSTTLTEALQDLEEFSCGFDRFIEGDTSRIQWIELIPSNKPDSGPTAELHDESLSVGESLKPLYESAHGLVLTSATLTTNSNYDYIKQRIGMPENVKERQINSPFDYKKQMFIYIIDDAVNPTAASFDRFTASIITSVALLTSGRTLGLFTSHASIKSIYHDIIYKLNKANIKLLAHGITGGRNAVSARFKKDHASVLLGTYTFWEGFDIPGESLSNIIIPKLPFPVPNNPVLDALAEKDRLNSFTDLSIPTMILKLRQGMGRLIRNRDDRGAVIILDSRFLNQDYGQAVLKSLPPATVYIGSHRDLTPTLTNWFGKKTIAKWRLKNKKL